MINSGKKFEQLIKLSCKEQGIDCTRLKDAGWQGEETKRRFTSRNICDFILFDSVVLLFLEAKSRKTSVRFDDLTQQKDLWDKSQATNIPNLLCGYLFEFSNSKCYWYLDCRLFEDLKRMFGKKSFNPNDLQAISLDHSWGCTKVNLFVPEGKRKQRLDIEDIMYHVYE